MADESFISLFLELLSTPDFKLLTPNYTLCPVLNYLATKKEKK